MEFPTSLAAALLAVLLYAALRRWWRRSASKALPGPAGLPLVGSLPFLDPDLHTYFARLAAAYGPIFSIKLGAKLGVVISSPALAREVLKDQDAVFANRDVPAVARVIAYGGADIVWNPNGPTWRMLRRVCVREMLGPASLDAVYGLRRQEVRSTVHHLYSHAGAPVDVGAQLFLTVMNVITSMLWGGTMEGEERSAVGKEFRELVAEITELLGRPNLSDFFPVLARFDLQGMGRQMRTLLERFDRIFEPIIDRRRKVGGGGAKDFLDYMLGLEKEGDDAKTPFTMFHIKALLMALKNNNYDADPMLRACGISINSHFTRVDGRVLPAPKAIWRWMFQFFSSSSFFVPFLLDASSCIVMSKLSPKFLMQLKVGNGDSLTPMKGRWNFNNKKLIEPCTVDQWAVVNFSARCDIRNLIGDLTKCGRSKGIYIAQPLDVFEENPSIRRAPPAARVEEMFKRIGKRLLRFLLCLLPERKNCDVYGPWKRKCLADLGIVTQCMAPTRINDQYLTNILLKINAKLGGVNSLLQVEYSPCIPLISNIPTIIFGMDVSHGSPGQSDVPSIAAVVSSRQWPRISRYRASVQTQPARVEMIENLFKPLQENRDEGIIRELLIDFYASSAKRKPEQIIIFRLIDWCCIGTTVFLMFFSTKLY